MVRIYLVLQPLSLSPMSPVASPSKDKYGDRFIPSRAGASWHINFNIPKVSILELKQADQHKIHVCLKMKNQNNKSMLTYIRYI